MTVRQEPAWKVHAAIALVQVMFASLPIAAKFVLPEIGPLGIVLFRIAGSAVAFSAAFLVSGAKPVWDPRQLAAFAGLAVIGVFANQVLFLEGVARTTAINANILITTIPVFTILIALILKRERATATKLGGIVLAGAGAVYLIGPDRISLDPSGASGAAMITVNSLFYGSYLVLSKDVLRRHPPIVVTTYTFIIGTFMIMPFGLGPVHQAHMASLSARAAVALAYIVAFPSVGAYFLSVWALERTASSQVAMWVYIQPVLTAAAAPAILGERVTARAALAAAAIFAGLAVVIWGHQRAEGGPRAIAPPEQGF